MLILLRANFSSPRNFSGLQGQKSSFWLLTCCNLKLFVAITDSTASFSCLEILDSMDNRSTGALFFAH